MTMFDRRRLQGNYCWSSAKAPTRQEQFSEIGIVRIWNGPRSELATHRRNRFHGRHLILWVGVRVSEIADLVPRAPDNRKPAHYPGMEAGRRWKSEKRAAGWVPGAISADSMVNSEVQPLFEDG